MNDNKSDIKKLKISMLSFLIFIFALITTITAYLAYYNWIHAVERLYLYSNFLVLSLTSLLVALVSICLAFYGYEKRLAKYVDTDKLTNGINYEKFLKEAQFLIDSNPDKTFAVFYADIQNFKYINDTFGYDVGDNLLMFISQKIKDALNEKGYYARISADNYTAIIPYDDKNDFIEPIYSIIDDIYWFEEIQIAHYKPEIYVGIYCSGDTASPLTISEMIDRANMTQKSIKGSSEYHIAFYNEEIRERVIAEKDLERRMDTALANGEFKVYFQPKYEVGSGEIVGAEALVRWDSPESGFMSPAKFIPLFEQNGFIINLDQYVFETVCKNIREWLDLGIRVVPVSVNVSRLQFYRLDFIKRYTKIKEKYNIPNGLLELEFTESIVFESLEILKKIVLGLKKEGFSCSIDDFGSGYSSLNILKNLPMDTLKLDKLFFQDSENLERDKALISSVVTMSRALNMKTVAEGIENWAQVSFLREIGCDIIQGYVYSEPIPHARYTVLLEGNRRKELPAELRKGYKAISENDPNTAIKKYMALRRVLDGLLIEVDFNTGEYEFLNVELNEKFSKWITQKTGNGFDEIFSIIIEKYVHPDDVKVVKNRCSSISVMSSFYQNATKIITDMRVLTKATKSYEWARLIIVRINPTPEDNDFRAFVYTESIVFDDSNSGIKIIASEPLKNALLNMCSVIYVFELKSGTFKKLYCDPKRIGDQPDVGEITWLNECYLPKIIAKKDVGRVKAFCNPDYIKKSLEGEVSQMSIFAEAILGDKNANIKITIIKMDNNSDSSDDGYVLVCNTLDE